jgi:hypothetical protein
VPGDELIKQSTCSNSGSNIKLTSNSSLNKMQTNQPYHNAQPNTYHKTTNRTSSSIQQTTAPQTREPSPIRDLIRETKRKSPIYIKRGPRGYGFTLRAIKVYYGDTETYTIQHLVIQVDEKGPAYESGLRAQDLIIYVNEKCVCGLLHHEMIRNILSGGSTLQLRTIQLNETTIKSGGRKRSPSKSKLSRPLTSNNTSLSSSYSAFNRQKRTSLFDTQQSIAPLAPPPPPPPLPLQQSQPEKKKKATLFRKLSERRAQRYELQNGQNQTFISLQNQDQNKRNMSNSDLRLYKQQNDQQSTINRQTTTSRSPFDSSTYASSSSSPASSVPNSPAIGSNSRPRSLIVMNNNFLTNSSPEPILAFIGFNNNNNTALSSSSSSLSSSPLNLSSNYNPNIIQPISFLQQRNSPLTSYSPSNGSIMFNQQNSTFQRSLSSGATTQMLQSPSSSCCSSCASSCSSLNSQMSQQQQQQQLSILSSNAAQNNLIHLSPSPLAISDGMAISYGNPNTTQTFTPTTQLQNLINSTASIGYRPKVIISNSNYQTMNENWHLSPTMNLVHFQAPSYITSPTQQQQQQQQHHQQPNQY